VRAARAEDANRKLAQHAADTDASLGRLQVDVAMLRIAEIPHS
jgi:hypothetical protein